MCGNDCQKKMFVAVFVGQHGGEKEKEKSYTVDSDHLAC